MSSPPSLEQMTAAAGPLPRPARDFFEYRRERAGIPDAPLGVHLTPCGLTVPADFAADFGPLPIICGLPECAPCGEASARYWFGDVPPPRPMRPELDGEAPAGELERRRLFWEVLLFHGDSLRLPWEVQRAIDAGATLEQIELEQCTRVRVWLEPPSSPELDRLVDDGGRA